MSDAPKPLKINRLNAALMYKLANLIKEKYQESKLTDEEFAEQVAVPTLKHPITKWQVQHARHHVLGIPGNFAKALPADTTELTARVVQLEAQVAKLVKFAAFLEADWDQE